MTRTLATVDDVALWAGFPAAFKRARLAAGLSQWRLEFDHYLGLHMVSQWERGIRRTNWPVLVRVCRTLKVEAESLFPHPRMWWYPTDVALAMSIASCPVPRPRQEPAEWSLPAPVVRREDV